MTLHREGTSIILTSIAISIALGALNWVYIFPISNTIGSCIFILLLVMLVLVIQFFRIPKRQNTYKPNEITCPADGKVVVIEETTETEYFNDKRIQVSIFMSPLNVHANYYPIKGSLPFVKYHPGKFLVAWHPKSSTENERTTIVVKNEDGKEILIRQIAGAVARRICYYGQENDKVAQAGELGFIKFGSRVDLFMPLGTKIDVKLGQNVQAKLTSIGFLS
ncbi:MAG: phosphatidylserine decarboxylase family protein [Cryomorphaceae bacterium]|nr:phosphatidylserine decarboxylase family protein [Cryomorphaceae bacterium]|tara:strand:- start:521 stop:1183 length:663 start_codon:yes stop_codon:yes gene_type:complete